jgi:uncharacterized phage infection (PIP) family protein YhgE
MNDRGIRWKLVALALFASLLYGQLALGQAPTPMIFNIDRDIKIMVAYPLEVKYGSNVRVLFDIVAMRDVNISAIHVKYVLVYESGSRVVYESDIVANRCMPAGSEKQVEINFQAAIPQPPPVEPFLELYLTVQYAVGNTSRFFEYKSAPIIVPRSTYQELSSALAAAQSKASQADQLAQQVQQLQSENEQLKLRLANETSKSAVLSRRLEEALSDAKILRQQLGEKIGENNELRKRLSLLESENSQLRDEVLKLKTEKTALETRLGDLQGAYNSILGELGSLKGRYETAWMTILVLICGVAVLGTITSLFALSKRRQSGQPAGIPQTKSDSSPGAPANPSHKRGAEPPAEADHKNSAKSASSKPRNTSSRRRRRKA